MAEAKPTAVLRLTREEHAARWQLLDDTSRWISAGTDLITCPVCGAAVSAEVNGPTVVHVEWHLMQHLTGVPAVPAQPLRLQPDEFEVLKRVKAFVDAVKDMPGVTLGLSVDSDIRGKVLGLHKADLRDPAHCAEDGFIWPCMTARTIGVTE